MKPIPQPKKVMRSKEDRWELGAELVIYFIITCIAAICVPMLLTPFFRWLSVKCC